MKPTYLIVMQDVSAEQVELIKEVRGVEYINHNPDSGLSIMMLDSATANDEELFTKAMLACKAIAPNATILAHGALVQTLMPDMPLADPRWN